MSDPLRDSKLDEFGRHAPTGSLLELLSTWEPLDEEFPEIDDLEPVEDVGL
jgi:hypothetical protein